MKLTDIPPASPYVPVVTGPGLTANAPTSIEGWCGPVEYRDARSDDQDAWLPGMVSRSGQLAGEDAHGNWHWPGEEGPYALRVYLMDPEVQALFVRTRNLPAWMVGPRGPVDAFEPGWLAGAFIACALSGVRVIALLGEWTRAPDLSWSRAVLTGNLGGGSYGVNYGGWYVYIGTHRLTGGPATGEEGKAACDAALLARGCALIQTVPGVFGVAVVLPFRDGAKLWTSP